MFHFASHTTCQPSFPSRLLLCYVALFFLCLGGGHSWAQDSATGMSTLEEVRARDAVRCGVHLTSTPGLSMVVREDFRGFEVDFCRAIAAAVLGNARKVNFVPVSARTRFGSLERDEMDVLVRSVTWNSGRDSRFVIGPIIFYDEQGFLVRNDLPVQTIRDFVGQKVCVVGRTTTEENLLLLQQIQSIDFTIVQASDYLDAQERYLRNECTIWTADRTQLIAHRSTLVNPQSHRFLDLGVIFSKEPLAVVVQRGDDEWADIVRWSIFATILAEEMGINSNNVREKYANSRNANIQRLLGVEGAGATPELLGLSADAFYKIIAQVGNYDEIYQRNFSNLGLARGLNALYSDGGLLYAPPMR